ncbi:MAG TPA: thioredoxin domain-containing protein [Longimicrobiales bacterium]
MLILLLSGFTQHRAPAVQVVEFSDFSCGYCRQFALEVEPALRREFVTTGRVRWTFIATSRAMLTGAEPAARAADCVAQQKPQAFLAMRALLFERQRDWLPARNREAKLAAYAARQGIPGKPFLTCLRSRAAAQRVAAGNRRAAQMKVRIRPTFFVNGRRVEGALPLAEFRAVILSALEQQS